MDYAKLAKVVIDRVQSHETIIKAFTQFQPEKIIADAQHLKIGPLNGLSVGVKDIIETADYNTEYGSAIYHGYRSVEDAACVTLLKNAGALIAGKTVTTEFAFFKPGKTVNPYDYGRTPGGSSSGSAAAVACGMIDIGLASQTAASLTRPASYCGVVGFKPSVGRYNSAGVKYLAPSFDALGVITPTVNTAIVADSVLKGPCFQETLLTPLKPKRIGFCLTPWWQEGEPEMHEALEKLVEQLSHHVDVEEVDLSDFSDGAELHLTIMAYEVAQSLAWEFEAHKALLSKEIITIIEKGKNISRTTYDTAQEQARALRQKINILFDTYDVLLAPAAPGVAPLQEEGTGSPLFSRLWTLLYLPSLTLPGLTCSQGLPIGSQFLGRYGQDEQLLAYGLWLESILPPRPKLA